MYGCMSIKVIPEALIPTVDIIKSKAAAQSSKMFIDKLVLHPIKIRFNYIHTNFPRESQVREHTFITK